MEEFNQHKVIKRKFYKFSLLAIGLTLVATLIALIKKINWEILLASHVHARHIPISEVTSDGDSVKPNMTLINAGMQFIEAMTYGVMTLIILIYTVRMVIDIIYITIPIDSTLFKSERIERLLNEKEPLLGYMKNNIGTLVIMIVTLVVMTSGGIGILLSAITHLLQASVN